MFVGRRPTHLRSFDMSGLPPDIRRSSDAAIYIKHPPLLGPADHEPAVSGSISGRVEMRDDDVVLVVPCPDQSDV